MYQCTYSQYFHCREGNVRQVQTLITQGHDVNSLDAEYRTPLMYW